MRAEGLRQASPRTAAGPRGTLGCRRSFFGQGSAGGGPAGHSDVAPRDSSESMRALVFTLLSEGSSDRTLIPILLWTLRQHSESVFQPQWADLRRLPNPPRSLEQRLQAALALYPCDLLFVHRDGNRSGLLHDFADQLRGRAIEPLRGAPEVLLDRLAYIHRDGDGPPVATWLSAAGSSSRPRSRRSPRRSCRSRRQCAPRQRRRGGRRAR